MRKKLGVLDEVAYSYRLMQRLNKQARDWIMAYSFSEPESLETFLENDSMDILLVGEAYEEAVGALNPECKIIFLSESENPKGVDTIYKYQSTTEIIKRLGELLEINDVGRGETEKVKIYGVYSPVHRCGKTRFSNALLEKLRKEGKVLFINLEPFFDVESGCENEYEEADSLAEILYYLEQGNLKDDMLAASFVNYRGVKTISPIQSVIDLQSVTEELWNDFFTRITAFNEFDSIVVSFSECVSCFVKMFEFCDRVYMPVLEDSHSKMKVGQFDSFIRKNIRESALSNIYKVEFPMLGIEELVALEQIIGRFLEEMDY